MEEKKQNELKEEQLEEVAGGVIPHFGGDVNQPKFSDKYVPGQNPLRPAPITLDNKQAEK